MHLQLSHYTRFSVFFNFGNLLVRVKLGYPENLMVLGCLEVLWKFVVVGGGGGGGFQPIM